MDAVTLVASLFSLVTAAVALTSSTSLIVKKGNDSTETLGRISEEMETLSQIIQDVEEVRAAAKFVIADSSHGESVAARVQALDRTCKETRERFFRVAHSLEQLLRQRNRSNFASRLRLAVLFVAREDGLMLDYHSLRDSVGLARDLASDLKIELLLGRVDERLTDQLNDVGYRVNHQLLQLTTSMATLLADEDDDEVQQEPIAENADAKTGRQAEALREKMGRGGFRKMARIGRRMVELSETGFTRSIALIIETLDNSPDDGRLPTSRSVQKEIRALGKLDTASDADLISHDMLIQEGLREDLLIPIPVEKRVELHGLDGAKCIPEWEVTLSWYKGKDMKKRKTKFQVVKEAPFEVLFSSDSSFQQLSDRSVLVSKERQKSKEEVQAEIKASEEKRKKALERVEEEYREAEAKKLVPIRRNTRTVSP